jgi:hypothetical protein
VCDVLIDQMADQLSQERPMQTVGHEAPLREGWLLRSDKIVSKVMLHRFARLYEGRLEIFHVKEKDAPPEMEHVIPLKGASIQDVQALDADVKPRGSNLFLGYMSGDIKSRSLVRMAPLQCKWCSSQYVYMARAHRT